MRERRDDVFRDAIAKKILVRITTQIVEGKDCDGRLVAKRRLLRHLWIRACIRVQADARLVNPHRLVNVLDRLFAQILEGCRQLSRHLVIYRAGHIDLARPAQPFQTRGHVDAVAMNVVSLDNYVAHVDTDTESDSAIFGQGVIAPEIAV